MRLNLYQSNSAYNHLMSLHCQHFFGIYFEADNRDLYHYNDQRPVIGDMLRAHQSLVKMAKSTTMRD